MDGLPEYWQSDDYNKVCYNVNVDLLLSLAVNRFRWEGLPSTCDARFLERTLHRHGIATICHAKDTPDIWQTLIASPQGKFNVYGVPVQWRASGMNQTEYLVQASKNGVLGYYSQTRLNPWAAITMYANKLTMYQRTEDVNLFHQRKPYVMVAPQEKRLELTNIFKQVAGFEPGILGDSALLGLKDSVFTVDTQVPYIGEELARGYQNVINQYLMLIGIPHLAFEKGERMIEDEARANSAPTNVNLLNCLNARRQMCDELRKLDPAIFADTYVYFNDDYESYNWNYLHNVESQAQDGVIVGDAND